MCVVEVRRGEGGSSLDSGGAGGLMEKECLLLGIFLFFVKTQGLSACP